MEFPQEVIEQIKHYVYLYLDPFENVLFYIGKGYGNRVFQHLSEGSGTEMGKRIKEIQNKGKEPKIEILRYGLTENVAKLIEAAAIDLIGIPSLTNRVRGFHSQSSGRVLVKDILTTYTAKHAEINHIALLLVINNLYRSDMTDEELYEATRGVWRIGPKRNKVDLAFAVYRGIVREVYRICCWSPAGTLTYNTRNINEFITNGDRWEFKGKKAEENIRKQYIGKSVRRYLGDRPRNPIRYVNI
jgi:hypothetical protein